VHSAKPYTETLNLHTIVTFKALVEAIIPSTHNLFVYGPVHAVGAVELFTYEYMIWAMDHSLTIHLGLSLTPIPLATPTAHLLDAGAIQLIASGRAKDPQTASVEGGGPFSTLSHADRFRALAILEQGAVDPGYLPQPYQYDLGYVQFIVDYLNRATMFGYYSEWSAYGTTRLNYPDQRVLEHFPLSWVQVGYPGVSLGYRDYRGTMATIIHEGGGSSIV